MILKFLLLHIRCRGHASWLDHNFEANRKPATTSARNLASQKNSIMGLPVCADFNLHGSQLQNKHGDKYASCNNLLLAGMLIIWSMACDIQLHVYYIKQLYIQSSLICSPAVAILYIPHILMVTSLLHGEYCYLQLLQESK